MSALATINHLSNLIDHHYLDQDLLLYEFGDELYLLERAITNFEHRKASEIPSIQAAFPHGYSLLKTAAKEAQRRSKEISSRLDRLARAKSPPER